ncbi:protein [Escherichia coli]|uniref:Protein n=1 Tax=Escherichia coli TaxID=562 RepID=A0A2X3KFD7_ECOLX|nr:protein [Escherichia coli]
MQARQSEEMANAQSFLNRLWTFESDGKQWFNPDVSVIYPDRIRRRPPGTTSKGLGAHTDSGRWNAGCFQRISAFSPTSLMAIWRNMIPGMRHIVRKLKSTRWTTPPNVPCFGHSRAGQRSLICCLVRGCCTLCPFLKPWRTYCYVRCLMMCRRMNCAA